jgi:hypothetical protein
MLWTAGDAADDCRRKSFQVDLAVHPQTVLVVDRQIVWVRSRLEQGELRGDP